MDRHLFVRVLPSLLIFFLVGSSNITQKAVTIDQAAPLESLMPDSGILEQRNFYEDLPVGNLEVIKSADDWATAIFLPQYHRSPGSSVEDSVNDKAQTTQEQTELIIEKITSVMPVKLLMAEGELRGEVSIQKRSNVLDGMNRLERLSGDFNYMRQQLLLNPINHELEDKVINEAQGVMAQARREVSLMGALFLSWAKNSDLILVGSENAETISNSRELVRNHIYIQDRINSLSSGNTSYQDNENLSMDELRNILKNNRKRNTLNKDLATLKSQAVKKNKTAVIESIDKFLATYSLFGKKNDSANISAPDRKNNPYSDITSLKELETTFQANETMLEQIVIEKRNKETAINFADALKNYGQDIGLIQFGAGHKEGLVNELQAVGISVIIISPAEVSRLERSI